MKDGVGQGWRVSCSPGSLTFGRLGDWFVLLVCSNSVRRFLLPELRKLQDAVGETYGKAKQRQHGQSAQVVVSCVAGESGQQHSDHDRYRTRGPSIATCKRRSGVGRHGSPLRSNSDKNDPCERPLCRAIARINTAEADNGVREAKSRQRHKIEFVLFFTKFSASDKPTPRSGS